MDINSALILRREEALLGLEMLRSTRLVLGKTHLIFPVASSPTFLKTPLKCASFSTNESSGKEGRYGGNVGNLSGLLKLGTAGLIASGLGFIYYQRKRNDLPVLPFQLNASSGDQEQNDSTKHSEVAENSQSKVSIRERRYKDFSSVHFKGEPYMTPRDFVESVTVNKPRSR